MTDIFKRELIRLWAGCKFYCAMRQIKGLEGKKEPKILLWRKKKKRETLGKIKVPRYLSPNLKKKNVGIDK